MTERGKPANRKDIANAISLWEGSIDRAYDSITSRIKKRDADYLYTSEASRTNRETRVKRIKIVDGELRGTDLAVVKLGWRGRRLARIEFSRSEEGAQVPSADEQHVFTLGFFGINWKYKGTFNGEVVKGTTRNGSLTEEMFRRASERVRMINNGLTERRFG